MSTTHDITNKKGLKMKRTEQLVNILEDSDKNYLFSKLPESIFKIQGMSGKYFKNVLNNILSNTFIKEYLEIGVWKGSTCVAGLYENQNRLNYHIIDNFCSFGGPKEEFEKNFQTFLNKPSNIIDADCFSIKPSEHGIKNIDVYFFDGPHEKIDQYNALKYYYEYLNESFIFIVDDWNWEMVRQGTWDAIKDLNLNVHKNIEHFTETQDSNTWWNGCSFFVLEK